MHEWRQRSSYLESQIKILVAHQFWRKSWRSWPLYFIIVYYSKVKRKWSRIWKRLSSWMRCYGERGPIWLNYHQQNSRWMCRNGKLIIKMCCLSNLVQRVTMCHSSMGFFLCHHLLFEQFQIYRKPSWQTHVTYTLERTLYFCATVWQPTLTCPLWHLQFCFVMKIQLAGLIASLSEFWLCDNHHRPG